MFTYPVSDKAQKSLYVQLYEYIKQDITGGKLKKNEKLPSKRAAAKNLGISVITVENAYAALQSEGYIYSLPKKGFYVSEISKLYHSESPAPAQSAFSLPAPARYRYDFSSNGVAPENFPFSVWAKLMRETFQNAASGLLTPPPTGGINPLKTALCRHLKAFRGMEVSPSQIIIGAGTEYLYSLIIQLLGGNKRFAVQNPGYAKIAKIYKSVGIETVFIPEDRAGIDVNALSRSGADVAHISPAHAYPSGIVMHASRRNEVLNWASESDRRYIIEDDYDSEFRLSGRPLPTLYSLDKTSKVIYVNTFTKSLSPSVRIAYMVLPPGLVETFYRKLGFYSSTVSAFEQYTLAKFIDEGYFEKHINRMRNYYKKIRNLMLDEIRHSALAARSEVAEQEAGLHFLLKLKTDKSDAVLKEKAAKRGLHLSFLSEFYLENAAGAPSHTIVVNYSTLKKEEIADAVAILCDILK